MEAGREHASENPFDEEAWWLVTGSPVDEFMEFDPVAYGPPVQDAASA